MTVPTAEGSAAPSARRIWLVLGVFLCLGAATRFYRLGWSFIGDETCTFQEARSLWDKPFFVQTTNANDLIPRGAPVSYLLQSIVFRVFGEDEVSSRLGSAAAGTLAIAVCVWIACRVWGLSHACILGGLLLVWPQILYHSQTNRYYGYAMLFSASSLLLVLLAWQANKFWVGAASGLLSAVAMATHTFTVTVPIGLAVFLAIEILAKRSPISKRALAGYLLVGTPVMLVAAWMALRTFPTHSAFVPQDHGAVQWTVARVLLAFVNDTGWGACLLAAAGCLFAWWHGDALDRMCAAVAATVLGVGILAPRFVLYYPRYTQMTAIVFFLLGARVLMLISASIRSRSSILAVCVPAAAVLFSLPSFVSYYKDGDRWDFRGAAGYIRQHAEPGDQVAGYGLVAVNYYLGREGIPIPSPYDGAACVHALDQLAKSGKRTWVVWFLGRNDIPSDVDRWVSEHAVRVWRAKKTRYDYSDYVMEVYRLDWQSKGSNPTMKQSELLDSAVDPPRLAASAPASATAPSPAR